MSILIRQESPTPNGILPRSTEDDQTFGYNSCLKRPNTWNDRENGTMRYGSFVTSWWKTHWIPTLTWHWLGWRPVESKATVGRTLPTTTARPERPLSMGQNVVPTVSIFGRLGHGSKSLVPTRTEPESSLIGHSRLTTTTRMFVMLMDSWNGNSVRNRYVVFTKAVVCVFGIVPDTHTVVLHAVICPYLQPLSVSLCLSLFRRVGLCTHYCFCCNRRRRHRLHYH